MLDWLFTNAVMICITLGLWAMLGATVEGLINAKLSQFPNPQIAEYKELIAERSQKVVLKEALITSIHGRITQIEIMTALINDYFPGRKGASQNGVLKRSRAVLEASYWEGRSVSGDGLRTRFGFPAILAKARLPGDNGAKGYKSVVSSDQYYPGGRMPRSSDRNQRPSGHREGPERPQQADRRRTNPAQTPPRPAPTRPAFTPSPSIASPDWRGRHS